MDKRFQIPCQGMASEEDPLRGMRRVGTDGRDALVASDSPSRVIPKGEMPFRHLAPADPVSPKKPRSTIVEGVRWCVPKSGGGPGVLVFPNSFAGEVETDVATSETLAHYGAKFANRVDGQIDIPIPHQQTDFTYARDYLYTYVMAAKEKGGAGGSTLERHSFCHTDMPYEDMDKSGVFVIGKFLDESETRLELTGFSIPRGETLWIPGGVIHTNNYLRGKWNTMLNISEPIEAVELLRHNKNFSLTFK